MPCGSSTTSLPLAASFVEAAANLISTRLPNSRTYSATLCEVEYGLSGSIRPSDGLSRLGLDDLWTLAQGWDIAEYSFPIELQPATFLGVFLDHLNFPDSG